MRESIDHLPDREVARFYGLSACALAKSNEIVQLPFIARA